MKKLLDWKLLLFASIFISLLLLSSVLYADFTELPSANWSRYITVYQSNVMEETDNYYNDTMDVVSTHNNIILTFIEDQKLNFEVIDLLGTVESRFSYNLDSNVTKISTAINSDYLEVLIATDEIIKLYQFDLESYTLVSETKIADDYDLVKMDQQNVLYLSNNHFYYFDGIKTHLISENTQVEQFDFKLNENHLFINLLEYDLGNYYFSMYKYDLSSQNLEYQEHLQKLNLIPSTVSLDANLYIKDKQLYNSLILKNTKYGQNFIFYTVLNEDTFDVLVSTDSSNMSYDPNIQFVDYKDQIYISYNDKSFIGKMEIGSQYQSYTNVFLKPITDNQLIDNEPYKILTKSKIYAPNSKFITAGNYHYLITNEIDHKRNNIYLSSDHPVIISKSKSVNFNDYKNIFFGALTYIPASIMTSWTVIIGLLFPVIFIIIPISILKMTWVERNQIKMLYSALIAYIVVKVYYVYSDIHLFNFNDRGLGIAPFHMSSLSMTILTFVLTTIVSLMCLYLFLKKKPTTHFIASFFIFFACEMIQYMLYITCYAVMYM